MKIKSYYHCLFICLNLFIRYSPPVIGCDNAHFYRATLFQQEPRFATSWLSTYESSVGRGSTSSGRNASGAKVPLLDIYGIQNMQFIGSGINLQPGNFIDDILLRLQNLPTRDQFGFLSFSGSFKTIEAPFNLYQNLINGFFLQAYLPIRKLSIKNISYQDLSPLDGPAPNKETPEWQIFLQNLNPVLAQFNINIKNSIRSGPGDFSLLLGWAYNNVHTVTFDYIDVDAKIGALFPTGKRRDLDNPFSLPLGYDGHWAVPLRFDFSIGALDWFTYGLSLDALFFFDKTQKTRIRTDNKQQGFIKLQKNTATIDRGTLWNICTYVKADHVVKGLSFFLGYTYSHQDSSCIRPSALAYQSIANHDNMLKAWSMHVLHAITEYDCSQEHSKYAPIIGFSYNYVIDGKRIFLTDMLFGSCSLYIDWRI